MYPRRRILLLAVTAMMLARPGGLRAQKKAAVIGLLWADSVKPSPISAVLLDALREKGWVVGNNLRVEDHVTLEGYGGLAESAAELVRKKVDVIVINGSSATVIAAKATRDTPIVALNGQDPVALGVAKSLSRPGGNVTGIVTLTADLTVKRMELMKELVPGLSRIGVMLAPNVGNPNFVRESQIAAQRLNLQVQFVEVGTAAEIDERIAELARAGVGLIAPAPSTFLASHSSRIVSGIAKHRLPAVYGNERYADAGGLLTLGASIRKSYARLADYVDRILKGARADELPIEQITGQVLVVNLKSANALGIKVPHSILMRADRVIE